MYTKTDRVSVRVCAHKSGQFSQTISEAYRKEHFQHKNFIPLCDSIQWIKDCRTIGASYTAMLIDQQNLHKIIQRHHHINPN